MNETEARTFRAAYGAAVTRYTHMSKAALMTEERGLMEEQGIQRVYGGPVSKDEFISSVLNLRGYTIAKVNEATHVIAHETPWPDCEHCQAAAAFVPTGTGWPVA